MVENRGPELTTAIIILLVLAWITFVMRCWVRIRIIKAFAIDDWLVSATMILFSVYSGMALDSVATGTGRHFADLTVQQRVTGMKVWWICGPLYIITTTFVRVAAGAFLLRIAIRKLHRNIIYVLIAVNIAFNIYFLFAQLFVCSPYSYFYTRFDGQHHGSCHNDTLANVTYAQSAVTAVIDWTFGILPIFIIWDLQMSRKKKILVGFVLGLAALASAATIIRFPYVYKLTHSQDLLWDSVDVVVWTIVEPGIGVTALNVATIRPLFHKILARIGLATGSTAPTSGQAGQSAIAMRRRGRESFRLAVPATEQGYSRQESPPNFDEEAQLSSIHPKLGMSSHVEAAAASQPAATMPKKQRRFQFPGRGRCTAGGEDQLHITKTMDIVTWSGQDSVKEPEPARQSP